MARQVNLNKNRGPKALDLESSATVGAVARTSPTTGVESVLLQTCNVAFGKKGAHSQGIPVDTKGGIHLVWLLMSNFTSCLSTNYTPPPAAAVLHAWVEVCVQGFLNIILYYIILY